MTLHTADTGVVKTYAMRLLAALVLCCFFQALPCRAAAEGTADAEALKALIREVLRENPELVLDILKENSELVLEIAQQGNMLRKRKAMVAQWEYDSNHPKNPELTGRAFRGNPSAPVTIVSYSDFTCPYCRQAEQTIAQLMEKHKGKLRVTFKALPKDDPFSLTLAKYAMAAFALEPEKGWQLFDVFFADPDRFEREGENFLKEVATSAGFDFRKLKSEAGSARVQELLDADRKEADRLGISGTPHFLVNDLLVRGAVAKDLFEEAIEMALEKKLSQ